MDGSENVVDDKDKEENKTSESKIFEYTYDFGKSNIGKVNVKCLGNVSSEEVIQKIVESRIKKY